MILSPIFCDFQEPRMLLRAAAATVPPVSIAARSLSTPTPAAVDLTGSGSGRELEDLPAEETPAAGAGPSEADVANAQEEVDSAFT